MQKTGQIKESRLPEQFDVSFKVLAEISPTGIYLTDGEGKCLYVNPAWSKMAGLTIEESSGDGWIKAIHKDDRSRIFSEWDSFVKSENPWESEYRFVDNYGNITWVHGTASLLRGANGSVECIIGININITDRKNYETGLKESEARLRLASQATGFGSYSYDFITHETYFSDEFLALYGILPGNTIEHNIDLLSRSFHPEDKEYFLNTSYKANDPKGSGILDVEFRIIKQDGEIRWLKARGRTIFSGKSKKDKPLHSNGLMQDITERKVIENAFKQAHDWQETIFEGSMDAIFISDENSVLIAVNKAACDLTGYSRQELLKMRIPDLHDELDLEAFRKYHKRIFQGEKILSEARILRCDGVKVDTEFNYSRISISGKYYMHTTARDVTERKKTVMALRESEELYRLLIDNCGLGIGLYSLDGTILMFNQVAIENLGGKPSDFIGKNLIEVFEKELGQKYIERFKMVAESEKPVQYEDLVQLGGKPGWYHSTHVRILNKNGEVEGIQVIANNITSSKVAEEKLMASEAEYRSLFENSVMGISQVEPGGKFIRLNKAYAEMYGYPDPSTMLRELAHRSKTLFSNPGDRKKVLELLNKNGFMAPTEFELNRRNGEKIWALVSAKQVKDSTGNLLYLQAEHIDITNLKKLEKERYLISLYTRNLIEASLDPLVTINTEGKVTDVNLATEKITGVSREKLIGSDFANYFTQPDKARRGYKTVFSEGTVRDYPLTIKNTSGREIAVLYNATLFRNENGEVQGVFAAARDITYQKKMEAELRRSQKLLEKLNQHLIEVRENERSQIALNLHDDLGQKLTAINLNIAWLKSRIGVQSKSVQEKFDEMSNMIKETIESIKVTSAFLRPAILFELGLVPAIKSQLGTFEKQTGIKCNFNYEHEELELEESVALILYRILQESLTNIARHSGASSSSTELVVRKNKIEMTIVDNGTGITKNKANSLGSMGIAGMKERVKSANGKIIIRGDTGAGTVIKVIIPLLKVKDDD